MGMEFGAWFWVLAGLSVASAIVHGLFFLKRPESLVRASAKTLFMGLMTAAFVVAGAPPPLVIALAAAAFGDFFLAFDKKWLLPFGILSFLIAQLAYLLIFFGLWMFSGDNAPLWPRYVLMAVIAAALGFYLRWFWSEELRRWPLSGAVAVLTLFVTGAFIPWFVLIAISLSNANVGHPAAWTTAQVFGPLALAACAIALGWLRRDLGAIKLGGMVYGGAITAMALQAMWLPWPGWPAMLGAVLFLISDFVLAAELFRLPADAPVRRMTAPVVWWTYAAAQVLIVWGIVMAVFA